jgi:iron complex outermembrane recepter protein
MNIKFLISSLFCLFTLANLSAQTLVKGEVKDKKGNTLVGVTVFEKGTFNGTATAPDGTFQVETKNDAPIMVFSYLGFATQEVKSDGKTALSVILLDDSETLKGVEVVGTRNINRTATETAVPIDIIPVSRVTNQLGQVDLNQLLNLAAPSFNSNRQSGSDGSDHIDAASLRGLGPDQTLVLINGQRRHQSSLVNLYGTRGRGNTGTDLNTIPSAAIERIEILRDGAAAQYGSDAIAGVINIVLKKDTERFAGNVMSGITQGGDGLTKSASANYGVGVGEKGYVNFTLAYLDREKTDRTGLAGALKPDLYRQKVGDASIKDFAAMFNASFPLANGGEVYTFGGLNHREGDAFAWTRSKDENRNVLSIYPDGFNPHISSIIDDRSLSVGIRGKVAGWNVDMNNTFGNNHFLYENNQTLNASLGSNSPLNFRAGGFELSQNTTNVRFSKGFEKVLEGLNVAWGVEHRFENYKIFAGEEGSWKDYGPVIFSRDSVFEGGVLTGIDTTYRPGGSQGFPGFRPSNEVDKSRTNIGGYVDAELDITKSLMVSAAVRYETYSDFGNTLNGKFAARYKFGDKFMLRSSFSTGFRAPSLAQVYFNSVFTNFIAGKPVDVLLAGNQSTVTRALGIAPLKEEKSQNLSVGFTTKPVNGLTVTVDGYMVNIQDRIVVTSGFGANSTTTWGRELTALNVGQAQFFTNALNTQTLGIDAIATYAVSFGANGGRLQTSLAANFNKMILGAVNINDKLKDVPDVKKIYFNSREEKFLLASAPPSKISLGFDYKLKRFNTFLRFTRFDKVLLEDFSGIDNIYTPKVTTDLTFGYELTKSTSIFLGGTNIFNVFPDKQTVDTESGGISDPVQMGLQGAFFFGRLAFKL